MVWSWIKIIYLKREKVKIIFHGKNKCAEQWDRRKMAKKIGANSSSCDMNVNSAWNSEINFNTATQILNRYKVNSLSYEGCNFVLLYLVKLFAVPLLILLTSVCSVKKDKIVLIHAMKAYRRVEVLLHSFLVFLVNGRDRSALSPGRFTGGKEYPVTFRVRSWLRATSSLDL